MKLLFPTPLLVLAATVVLLPAATTQPNVIFVLADDLGWGDLGVFYQNSRNFAANRNQPAFITPNLDAMAAEGMQLRRHYCPAPVCAPSRASLLLGVHQGHANVRDNSFDKALENNHTLASVMRQAGYATAIFGKWGLQGSGTLPEAHPQYRGFDYFYGYMTHQNGHHHYPKESGNAVWDGLATANLNDLDNCYTPDLWTARSKKWIVDHQAASPGQPFFIYLAYDSPHAQLQVPTAAYPAGGGTGGGVRWTGTPGAMINTAAGTVDSWIHPDYAAATYDNDSNSATAEIAWPDYAKRHATMIRRLDDAVADLIQTLKDLGIDNNTMIVFTSDNGPHNEAGSGGSYTQNPTFFDSFGPLDGIKRDTWEGGMREPTLVRWPGHIAAGSIATAASQFHDWMPTFAELGGLPAPARSDGVSLLPTLTGTGPQRESTIYVEYQYSGTTPTYSEFESTRRGATRNQEQVIHLEGYKGIRYNIAAATDDFNIYNTLTDPKETTNLAGSSTYFTGLQQRMKDRVLQVRRPGGGVTRPYDSANIPPVTIANTIAGLDYRAFEGSFPWVPDFTPLTAAASGSCAGIDLTVRTRDNQVGLLYSGYLNVPADGSYTLYLTADSRAFLRLHDASIIDADFGYPGGTELAATVNLKAGKHPLRLGYVRGTGGAPSLSLQWSSATIAKQAIPAANLLRVNPGVPVPPTANPDSATTSAGTPVGIPVLTNDSDDGTPVPLTISAVTQPAGGTAGIVGSNVTYTPRAGVYGDDAFTYTITDGQAFATAAVTVSVNRPVGTALWLPFDEAEGTLAFDAGGVAVGTLSNFAATTRITGAHTRALNFDGIDDNVAIAAYTPPLGSTPRTFTAWLKPAATQPELSAWLGYGTNTSGNRISLRIDNAAGYVGRLRCEVQSGYVVGTKVITDGAWHHVAVVIADADANGTTDVAETKLYVDGAADPSSLSSARAINTIAATALTIGGANHATGYDYAGGIDEVRIYPSALSAATIAAQATRNATADAWFYRHTGNATPLNTEWAADTDADGWTARLEFALGGNPTVHSTGIAPVLAADLTTFTFNRRRDGIAAASYIPELSATLGAGSWTAFGIPIITPHSDLTGFDRVSVTLPISVAPERFVRLRVNP